MKIRRIARSRVTPLLEALRAEGLTPEINDGIWLGAVDGEQILGVMRATQRDGVHIIDDLWVDPAKRTHGVASALLAAGKARYRPLWLICDEDAVDFYARRGFARVAQEEFPVPLAALYEAKGEWPRSRTPDHLHVAMRWDPADT